MDEVALSAPSEFQPPGRLVLAWRVAVTEFRRTPNQITLTRFAATIALYGLLRADRFWFVTVFLLALFTDLLDGYLARRLKQVSQFGMRLDSLVDCFLIVSGLWWLAELSPETYRGHGAVWCTVAVALVIPQLVAFAKLRSFAGFHLWSARITGVIAVAMFLSRIANSHYSVPLVLVAMAAVCEGAEEVAVCLLIADPFVEPRPSIFHYLRAKRGIDDSE